jgi:hypothetical protein
VEDIVREPVEMIDADLDAVAGGFFNGSFNAFSFNGNGSVDGNLNGNLSDNVAVLSANGNGNGNGNIHISLTRWEGTISAQPSAGDLISAV